MLNRLYLVWCLAEVELNIPCAVLNGANVANDVAHDHFAEELNGEREKRESV